MSALCTLPLFTDVLNWPSKPEKQAIDRLYGDLAVTHTDNPSVTTVELSEIIHFQSIMNMLITLSFNWAHFVFISARVLENFPVREIQHLNVKSHLRPRKIVVSFNQIQPYERWITIDLHSS